MPIEAIYPELSRYPLVSIDIETHDPNLEKQGPGSIRKDGFIAGIAIATSEWSRYYPIAHEGGGNLPKDEVVDWLRRELKYDNEKVGANIGYDLEWLASENIKVGGPKSDIIIAEALIDENQDAYDLDSIGRRYGLGGKDNRVLHAACAARGWTTEKQIKSNLWRLPAAMVGDYGSRDAALPISLLQRQRGLLRDQELEHVFRLEQKLVDVLLAMRLRGIPIDVDRAEQAIERLRIEQKNQQKILDATAGFSVDVWSSQSIQRLFDQLGLPYPRTEKGNPSFTAPWLATQQNAVAKMVLLVRQLDRGGGVFIKDKILGKSVKGRIHPLYRQTRSDDGGTRSGRLASLQPNMQQVPARNVYLAPIIRSCFVPDEGYGYGVFDYSQQEPRITVHYADIRGYKGAEEAVRRYTDNPRTDYHQMVADMCIEVAHVDIGRKNAKNLNLGMAYGMGIPKLAASLGLSVDEARPLFDAYHTAVPYVRLLGEYGMRQAKRRGWVKTLLGRRRHFPSGMYAHKALNAAVQGTAADMMKKAMVDLMDAGYLPYNVIHDETNVPIRMERHGDEIVYDVKQGTEVIEIMRNALPLRVPLVIDAEVGQSWGEAKEWLKV